MDEIAITPEGELVSWQSRTYDWCPECGQRACAEYGPRCVNCEAARLYP